MKNGWKLEIRSVECPQRLLVAVLHDYVCSQTRESQAQVHRFISGRGPIEHCQKLCDLTLYHRLESLNGTFREIRLEHVLAYLCCRAIGHVEERMVNHHTIIESGVLVELGTAFVYP